MAVKGQPIEDLEKQIVADIQATVDEAQKKVDKITYLKIPDIKNWRTPLVIEHDGKTTIHGERNPHIAFENATKKN